MAENSKVALVTGGSRGIGLGIARCLAAEGYRLAINGVRDEPDVSDVLQSLGETAPEVIYCQGDVSSSRERQRILDSVEQAFGQLNVLVNNAGVAPKQRADLLDADEESFDRLINVNLKGPYFLTQAAAKWMISQRQENPQLAACIINVSSISAVVASVNRGDYCLSKAAIGMSTQLWAVRLAEFSIPVYEIRPGIIQTDMTSGVREKYDRLIAEGLTLEPRWGMPEDVGRAVASLARGDLTYATGQVINIDGGLMIQRL
jgi:NAD(P)-dependent dehydrogenase (short-subunit alcohol dehydrogenase family)